jgi:hypothetical protein
MLDHVPWFHRESDATWMDSCVEPDNEIVHRLWPDRRRVITLALLARSPAGHLARTAITAGVRLRRARIGADAQDAPAAPLGPRLNGRRFLRTRPLGPATLKSLAERFSLL